MADAHRSQPMIAAPHWPVLVRAGPLEVRIAQSQAEVEAAQRLRYRVFYQEMTAIPSPAMRASGRDFDRFDAFCDHLLVVDRGASSPSGEAEVVGTYRLVRSDMAAKHGGFYTSGEYDLAPVLAANAPNTTYLELGRSCVLREYRAKPITLQMLWRGIVLYVDRFGLDVMFGCASFPGIDPGTLKLPLSYLHHFHRAPPAERVRARPELYVEMDLMPKEAIDERAAIKVLPPLIKGYVRAGSYIGDGAVVDRQFDTTDVLMYFPMKNMDPRWRSHFGRTAG